MLVRIIEGAATVKADSPTCATSLHQKIEGAATIKGGFTGVRSAAALREALRIVA